MLSELRQRLFTRDVQTTVSRFERLERIGHGGMGVVYRAWDPLLERQVAIKVLHPRTRDSVRILDEARALATLAHPNIVAVLDVGREGDEVFVVMEYVAGETLADVMARRPQLSELAPLFHQIAEGLGAAHDQGVVHHDIKPSNVLITTTGVARIADFGLARVLQDERERPIGGTRGFAAPEQVEGRSCDTRADLYSLTAIVYAATFGTPPVTDGGAASLPPGPQTPKRLQKFLRKGLRHDPEQRFETADAWSRALRRAMGHRGRRWLGSLGGFAIAVAGSALATGAWDHDAPCGNGGARDNPWSEPRREAARNRLASSQQQFTRRAFADVDGRMTLATDAWRLSHSDACTAGDHATVACLDAQRSGLQDFADWLPTATDVELQRIPDALLALPKPSDCLPRGPSVAPPGQLQKLDEVLARANSMLAGGRYTEARTLLRSVELPAGVREHSSRLGAHAYTLGRASKLSGDHPGAAVEFEKAYLLHLLAERDALAADAAALLAALYAEQLANPATARRWIRNSQAALHRRTATPAQRGAAYLSLGAAHYGLSQLDEASLALAEAAAALPPNHRSRVDLGTAQAAVRYQTGDIEGAIAAQRESLDASVDLFGEEHPRLVAPTQNLGILYEERGDTELARTWFENALALAERSLGPSHYQTAIARISLASHGLGRRAPDKCIELFERGLADLEATVGQFHPGLNSGLQGLAEAFVLAGRPQDAERTIVRALDIAQQQEAFDPRTRAGIFTTYASTLRLQGKTDEGLEAAREALQILVDALGESHPNVATVRLELSKLHLDRGESDLARAQVIGARDALRAAFGPEHPQVAEVEATLRGLETTP